MISKAIFEESAAAEKSNKELLLAAGQMIDHQHKVDNRDDFLTLSDVSGEVPSEHVDDEKHDEEEKKEGATG